MWIKDHSNFNDRSFLYVRPVLDLIDLVVRYSSARNSEQDLGSNFDAAPGTVECHTPFLIF